SPRPAGFDPLDHAYANSKLGGDLPDSEPIRPEPPDAVFDLGADLRPATNPPRRSGPRQASHHALLDDGPLELGEHTQHLEEGLTGRRRGIDPLLMEIQPHPFGMDLAEGGDEVLQGPAEAIDRPGGDNVEFAPGKSLEQP